VAAGFERIKFQNNQVTIKNTQRPNTVVFVSLTAILRNVITSINI